MLDCYEVITQNHISANTEVYKSTASPVLISAGYARKPAVHVIRFSVKVVDLLTKLFKNGVAIDGSANQAGKISPQRAEEVLRKKVTDSLSAKDGVYSLDDLLNAGQIKSYFSRMYKEQKSDAIASILDCDELPSSTPLVNNSTIPINEKIGGDLGEGEQNVENEVAYACQSCRTHDLYDDWIHCDGCALTFHINCTESSSKTDEFYCHDCTI